MGLTVVVNVLVRGQHEGEALASEDLYLVDFVRLDTDTVDLDNGPVITLVG